MGGKKKTNYRFLLTFSQDGRLMHGGAFVLSGRTSEDGGASRPVEAVLI